jgi:hypothetical protein
VLHALHASSIASIKRKLLLKNVQDRGYPASALVSRRSNKPHLGAGVGEAEADPARAKVTPNACSMLAPVLSMMLIGPPSTTNHLMPGREAATFSTRFLKYGALKNTSADSNR